MRRLCSGKTLAFQAKDAGSIPARRSNFLYWSLTVLRPQSKDTGGRLSVELAMIIGLKRKAHIFANLTQASLDDLEFNGVR